MTLIQVLKFWVDVIEQTAIPVDGERLTRRSKGHYLRRVHERAECSLKRRITRLTKWRKYEDTE